MSVCVCLVGPTSDDLVAQIEAGSPIAQLWEIRCDQLDDQAWTALPEWLSRLRPQPVLLTLRSAQHAACRDSEQPVADLGRAEGTIPSLAHRRAVLASLAALQPEWLDLEYPHDWPLRHDLACIAPHTRLVLSWHGQELPQELEKLLAWAEHAEVPSLFKIAPSCPHASDWIRWAHWWKSCLDRWPHLNARLLFQPQGPLGLLQRVQPAQWGQPWTFVAAQNPQEGQISVDQWLHLYQLRSLQQGVEQLFGVVGDPIAQSRGPILHCQWMAQEGRLSRYLPLRCRSEDWSALWPYLRQHAQGLAITTPLKRLAAACCDELDPIAVLSGSVNTLIKRGERWVGLNTDGAGALAAMGGPAALDGQKIAILGAGPTACAIAAAASNARCCVTMLARRPEQVPEALRTLVCVRPLRDWPQVVSEFDWIVQATTCGFENEQMAVDASLLNGQAILEVVQRDTPFAQIARQRGCRVVEGVEMFVHLSMMQATLWREQMEASARISKSTGLAACR
jgi:shikimate dehydrogenase